MFGCKNYAQITFIVLNVSIIFLIICNTTSGHALRSKREVIDSGNQNTNGSFAIESDPSLSQDDEVSQTTILSSSTSPSTTDVNNAIADRQPSHEKEKSTNFEENKEEVETKRLSAQSSQASSKSEEGTTILWTTERTTTEKLSSPTKLTSTVPETTSSTEKRAKLLLNAHRSKSNRASLRQKGDEEKWGDLKPVSEVDHNNVTFHKHEDLKTNVDLNIQKPTEKPLTANSEENESQLHAHSSKLNASPMDDNTHQNISSFTFPQETTSTTSKRIAVQSTTPVALTSSVAENKSTFVPSETTTMDDDISTVTEKLPTSSSKGITNRIVDESSKSEEISTLPTTTPSMTTLSISDSGETTPDKPSFTETTEGLTSTPNSDEDTTINFTTVKFMPTNTTSKSSVAETTESFVIRKSTESTPKNDAEKLTEAHHESTTNKQEHNEIETDATTEKKSESIIAINTSQNQPTTPLLTTTSTPAPTASSTIFSAAPTVSTTTTTTTKEPTTSSTTTISSTSTTPSTTSTSTTAVTTPSTMRTSAEITNGPQTETTSPSNNSTHGGSVNTEPLEGGSEVNPEPPSSGGPDTNAMIAIIISIVSVITLILLVSFLVVMRKRQKQLTYGQRCRPVGLDAYSLDNISVYNSVRRKSALRTSKRAYGNAAFDDPALKNNLLTMAQLATFAQKRSGIYEEFRDVPMVTARIDEVPVGCEDKNRYANVVPLPESRVHLERTGDDETTEYINANYVKGPKDTTHYYIACQAPLENTIIDFWRMIWEQNSRVIIMATDLTENGIEKCAEYLPPSFVIDNHVTFGDFNITLKNREVRDKYAVSTVHLKNSVSKTWREITHLWYQWPEVGVPGDEASVIAMLLEARSYLKMAAPEQIVTEDNDPETDTKLSNGNLDKTKSLPRVQGPLTVHCSPGTGRTGTIIACDIAIRTLEQPTRSVDIPQIVYLVRRGRASAVQTREQYEFIYKVSHVYATKLTGPANDN